MTKRRQGTVEIKKLSAKISQFTGERDFFAGEKQNNNKLCSLLALEVKCISKDITHTRYEFGVKASIATVN